jgi:glycopeptide antibiotics resistance protein
MDVYHNIAQSLNSIKRAYLKHWSFVGTTSSSILIVLACLYPFDIIYSNISSFSISNTLRTFFRQSGSIDDLSANILLFIPLGFSLAGMLNNRYSKTRKIISIFFLCAALSLFMEISQLFLSIRSPSILDLLMNGFGGFLGAILLYFRSTFLAKISLLRNHLRESCLTREKIIFMAIGYIGLLIFLVLSIQRTNNFSNWDQSFSLIVGNEMTGDRPWHGEISHLYIANQSLPESDVYQILDRHYFRDSIDIWVSRYELSSGTKFPDKNGYLPDLVWHDSNSKMEANEMLSIDQKSWLLTEEPATKLNHAIKQSSQFSLLLTIATNDYQQSGPARIVSLSKDLFQRNLTIGQDQDRLIVRLRTPWSGIEAKNPEFAFPGVFNDSHLHRLLITFDHAKLKLYVDSVENFYTIRLSADTLFFRFLPAVGIRNFQVTPVSQWFLRIVFCFLTLFFPMAFVLFTLREIDQGGCIYG